MKIRKHVSTEWRLLIRTGKSLLTVVAVMALMIVLTGCASFGHQFNYQAAAGLELGQTRISEYKQIFGREPESSGAFKTTGGIVTVTGYSYSSANAGTVRVRRLVLEFKNGLLNAYNYASSFEDNKTELPSDQINRIQKGVSTKTDVLSVLGKPHGQGNCPSFIFKFPCRDGKEVWKWGAAAQMNTFAAAAGAHPQSKNVFVSFGADDIVTKVLVVEGDRAVFLW